MKCPKCGAGLNQVTFQEFLPTVDCLIVDVLASCQACGAELRAEYQLTLLVED